MCSGQLSFLEEMVSNWSRSLKVVQWTPGFQLSQAAIHAGAGFQGSNCLRILFAPVSSPNKLTDSPSRTLMPSSLCFVSILYWLEETIVHDTPEIVSQYTSALGVPWDFILFVSLPPSGEELLPEWERVFHCQWADICSGLDSPHINVLVWGENHSKRTSHIMSTGTTT